MRKGQRVILGVLPPARLHYTNRYNIHSLRFWKRRLAGWTTSPTNPAPSPVLEYLRQRKWLLAACDSPGISLLISALAPLFAVAQVACDAHHLIREGIDASVVHAGGDLTGHRQKES